MKMKEKRKHIGLRPKRNNLRKDKKPANNHKFIQRSRQMEQMHRTESQYQGTIDDGSKLTADLLPLLNDETQFYEQLVSGYSSTITGMIDFHSH